MCRPTVDRQVFWGALLHNYQRLNKYFHCNEPCSASFLQFFSVSCWLLTWVRDCDSTCVLPLACLEFSLEDYRCNFSPSSSSWQEGDTHFFPLLWFFTFQWMAKRCRLDVSVGSGTSMKILRVSLYGLLSSEEMTSFRRILPQHWQCGGWWETRCPPPLITFRDWRSEDLGIFRFREELVALVTTGDMLGLPSVVEYHHGRLRPGMTSLHLNWMLPSVWH